VDNSDAPTVAYTRGSDLSGSLEGAGGIGGLLARSHGYSGGSFSTHSFYHADGNGNVTYLINSSQTSVASYRYDPFGNTISSSGTLASANVYRFSSKEFHELSGLYYYGYRWYPPNLQRWLNRDPIDEIGFRVLQLSLLSPSERPDLMSNLSDGGNLYYFVNNKPGDSYDAWGLFLSGCKQQPPPCRSTFCGALSTTGGGTLGPFVQCNYSPCKFAGDTPAGCSGFGPGSVSTRCTSIAWKTCPATKCFTF
jgi:RHS repeat-associated protein